MSVLIGRHCRRIAVKLAEAQLKKTEELLKAEKPNSNNRLRLRDIEIDLASGTVWRDGNIIDLPDLSYRLLATLVERAPAMISKDDLINSVWGEVVVSDETLMQRVKLLRQALGDDSQNPRYIASVRGRGYRLAAPVGETGTPPRRWLVGAVIGVLLIIGGWFLIDGNDPPHASVINTLAVLPFDDLSQDQEFGYFADGMQEELLARLAGLKEVSVLSRTSVERFRNSADSIPEISSALNADAIIEGSVRLSDDRIRVTVQLIDGQSDTHIWAESYEEQLSVANVFGIQQDVADSIAKALRTELQRQQSTLTGLPTTSIEAYDLYLLGRYHTFRQTPEKLEEAVQYLEAAVELDPAFAEAHATLGWAYSFLGTVYGHREPGTVFPKARAAALRALELDDQLADAHSLYADILTWYDWDFDLAEFEYRRAMALDPTNVLGYALLLSSQGRHDEAIALVEKRIAATPNDDYVWVNAAWRYLSANQFADAAHAAGRAGNHPDAASALGSIKLAQNEVQAAIEIYEEDLAHQGRGNVQLLNLAYAYFAAGERVAGQTLLDELENTQNDEFISAYGLAAIYFAAGDETRGFELLGSAVDARERSVIFLNISRHLADHRDDARFTALLQRVGLHRRISPEE
jgi:TolB-like protein/DNA-binding winged helix-turn-helix (wHTH) protein/Tfp pilus assembly protein PilF